MFKLAIQAPAIAALLSVVGISGVQAKEGSSTKRKTEGKEKYSDKEHAPRLKDEAQALAKWQASPMSLHTAYNALNGDTAAITPKPLKEIIAIVDDDAYRLELFKAIKAETATTVISDEDKELMKREIFEMANYAKIVRGQLLETLAEIRKNKSKYLDEEDRNEILQAMREGSFNRNNNHDDEHHKKDGNKKDNKQDKQLKHNKNDKRDKKHNKKDGKKMHMQDTDTDADNG